MDDAEGPSGPKKRPPIRLATGGDDRAEILLGPDIHRTCDAMVKALESDPEVYHRGGALVHLVPAGEKDENFEPGTPLIRQCPASYLGNRISLHARCLRKREEDWKPVSPPQAQVRAVHEQGYWPGLRELAGLVESPTMRPDGSIVQVPGYDKATRTIFSPSTKFAPVPDSPTQSDAALAYAHLAELFCDFPYVAESHRSATVAAILTLLARPAIRGSVPCWIFDAAAPRSGKSLQTDVIAIVSTGRKCSRMTYPENDEELEKVLAGYALAGARIIPFDNVARAFGGAALDKVITAVDSVDLRILGRSEIPTLPWRAIVLASGNNVRAKGDMLPRVLSPRLESPLENPEQRADLKHPRLREWALEHRARLAVDGLTLLRAYVVAGRPDMKIKWGGFDEWAALIASALAWSGAPDPMGARRGLEDDDDPTRVAESAVVAHWDRLCFVNDPRGLTVSGALVALYPPRSHHADAEQPPDGFDDLREALEHLTSARPGFAPPSRRVGEVLRRLKSKPVGGRKLVATVAHGGVARWRSVPL